MIVFRVDGNSVIGSGHVMRCLSLAESLNEYDGHIVFVLSDDAFQKMISDRGFKTISLGIDYQELSSDNTFLEFINDKKPDFVIVDSYFVNNSFLSKVRKLSRLVYIDDLGAFPYNVDILINYNAYGPLFDYRGLYAKCNEVPAFLLGALYAPLRKQFSNIDAFNVKEKCNNVLISTGGADPTHLSLELIKFIIKNSLDNYTFHFVVGSASKDLKEILKNADACPFIQIHSDVKDMSLLMRDCDIAVAAAGSTMYELCACGVPSITYVLADNQILGADAFQKLGIMRVIGDIRSVKDISNTIICKINELSNDYDARKKMSREMQTLVDGKGAERLAKRIIELC